MTNIEKYQQLKEKVEKLNTTAANVNIEVGIRKKEFKQKLLDNNLDENITFEELQQLKLEQEKILNEEIKKLEADKERLENIIDETTEKLSKIS